MPCHHSCTTACRHRSLQLYGLIGYFNVNISNSLIFVSAVFICCYNFCGGIFPVLKTNLEKHFCHKADSCTFMKCSKEQQQIIMLLAKRRKGPTLWSPKFCAKFWRKCPRAAGTHFPISKLQAWCFWSHLLQTCPSPLSSLSSDSSFQHYFLWCLFSFFKLSPSVFPSVLILLSNCSACFT